jgi:dTDP-4-amino-4,6-dideoxygalactose transaminase
LWVCLARKLSEVVLIPVSEISITRSSTIKDALARLEKTAVGILLLVKEDGVFDRTVTDGDLRRLLLAGHGLDAQLNVLPAIRSVVITKGYSRREALELMNKNVFNHLPVVDQSGHVIEVLDRKDIDEHILLSTPHMGSAEREFVEEAFRTNWIAPLGPNVDAFERELADLVGIKHAAAVSSGTAAIHLALRMLDVGPGDRVFCSSLTFAASANPIAYQGAEPVFIDSDADSWNMSAVALEKAFIHARKEGRLPKAVIVVNLYGQSADMDTLQSLCDQYRVPLVEDAAESLGAKYKGRASGTFGRMGIYSFNGNKIITTSGGGMLVSDDQSLIERARFLATQARDPALHYQHSEIGYNYRMSNILAGVGRGQLTVLQERVEARRAVFQQYREALADVDAIEWMPEPEWSYSTHWLTACTLNPSATGITSTELIRRLAADMIEARPLWKPMHLQPVFSACQYFAHGEESVSDRLFEHGVCLPSGSNMSTEGLSRVIDALRRILK